MSQPAALRLVLVFADAGIPGLRVAEELRRFEGHLSFKVISATDPPQVKQILQSQVVVAAVIEVDRKIGYALEVLRLLGTGNQAIPLFVYNGFQLPRIAEKTREYDHVQYCEDHRHLDRFIAMILAEVSKKKRGIIHGISLGNFLQLMSTEEFAGRIIVSSGAKKGDLFLQAGRLVQAGLNGSSRNLALAEMSSWEKVTVEIVEKPSSQRAANPAPQQGKTRSGGPDPDVAMDPEPRAGRIDRLRFNHLGKKISVDIHRLNSALQEIQGLLADELLRMDVFLSLDGRSLAGWNSHPLACSAFAAITDSL